jgi:hypothetical protein
LRFKLAWNSELLPDLNASGEVYEELALALGLPMELPRRSEIITVSFDVVAFSVYAARFDDAAAAAGDRRNTVSATNRVNSL